MYIDPGFGALLLQGIVAGLLGAVYVARQRVRALLRRLTGKTDPPAPPAPRRPE